MKRIALFVCTALATSCATVPRADPITNENGDSVVRVWIQDSPDLPPNTIIAGCNYWNPMKIRCEQTSNRDVANVRIIATPKKCEDVNGHAALAWAHPDKPEIEFDTDCFKRFFLGLDTGMMERVAAHEIGHELGIWDHIPNSCDPKDLGKEHLTGRELKIKIHPRGLPICGKAVMNPVESGLKYLTIPDSLAFDLRDPDIRIVRTDGMPKPTWDGCTYYRKK